MSKSINKNKETITNELGIITKKDKLKLKEDQKNKLKNLNQSLTEDQKLVLDMKEKMQTSHVFDKHSNKDIVQVKSNVSIYKLYKI